MAKLQILKGATDQTIQVFIQDSSKTTGEGLAGLAYNTGSLTAYYSRPGSAAAAITLATQTYNGAHSDGGFVAVDGTNMPGVYRLDLPDAVCATGVDSVILQLKGAANMSQCVVEIQLAAVSIQDAVRMGLTALPNVAQGNAGAIVTSGTGTAQLAVTSGNVTVGTIGNDVITAASIAAGAIDNATFAADVGTTAYASNNIALAADKALLQQNLDHLVKSAVDTNLATTVADTSVVGFMLATSVVSGYDRTTDSQQAYVDNGVTTTAVADAIWDEARSGHTAAGSFGQGVASVQGAVTGAVASVTTVSDKTGYTVSTVSDKTGYTLSAAGVDAVWDEVQSGHSTGGSFGLYLDAATSSRLAPTTAARTLDVSATGEAGIDWANIGSPTTTVALSNTSTGAAASVTGAVGSVTGAVGSVTAGVTVTTNNDKTGYTAATVSDKTGYSLATNGIAAAALATDALAAIQAEAEDALETYKLDRLVASAVPTSFSDTVAANSVVGHLSSISATTAYDRTTDSQQALVDNSVTVATVAEGVWALLIATTGTAAAGAARSITLASPASTTAQLYRGLAIKIHSGTGAGQCRWITDYTAGRVATVDSDWTTTPSTDSVYYVLAGPTDCPMPELAQAQPATSPTLRQALMLDYMALRNAGTSTATSRTVANDAGTVICKTTIGDTAGTFSKAKFVAGP
jgi:hypothetical protein